MTVFADDQIINLKQGDVLYNPAAVIGHSTLSVFYFFPAL